MQIVLAGIPIEIVAPSGELQRILKVNFAHLETNATIAPVLSYQVSQRGEEIMVQSGNTILYQGSELADVVFYLEKDLIIATQLKSTGILFFHAAALTYNNKTVMVVGESGAGKSSMTWGLLRHGFKYLSDELVPIDQGLKIYPFARAVNLKRELNSPYGLPPNAVDLHRFNMVPVPENQLETGNINQIDHLIFVKFNNQEQMPCITEISKGEAFLLLFKNLLNAKSFDDYGMGGISKILSNTHCYHLTSVTDMAATVALIQQLFIHTTE